MGSVTLFLRCLIYNSRSKRHFVFVNALLGVLQWWLYAGCFISSSLSAQRVEDFISHVV